MMDDEGPRAARQGEGVAVISGGSSGIGLACAAWLVRRGVPVLLLARREAPLREAALWLRTLAPEVPVDIRVLDVTDPGACVRLGSDLQAQARRPSWLVTAAGIATPGRFLDQPLDEHRRQMEVNYFGTLALVHALAPLMLLRGGRVVMIASGAALVGIPGYGAYGPSKFAVRGLAEVVRAELKPHGVGVTLAYPPDTDTPQWRQEQAHRPPETSAISAGGGLATASDVACDIMTAAAAGRFAVTTGLAMSALLRLHSLLAPMLRKQHDVIVRKHLSPARTD